MSLTLHYHPLSSFCWKALIGLYELEIPFEKHVVDLSNESARAAFARLWPLAKFPVLRDETRDRTVPESSIVLEYVDRLAAGKQRLIPADPDRALECRLRDRLFDSYIHLPMQTIVGDRLRPEADCDAYGVARARAQIEAAYALVNDLLGAGPWSLGEEFTLADCAAMPALFYGDKVVPIDTKGESAGVLPARPPIGPKWPNVAAYLERLKRRPSVARVLEEAAPYFAMFPA